MKTIRRIAAFLAAAWRAGEDMPLPDTIDEVIRERLAALDIHEGIALARGLAIRAGEKELARALQSVLLLHLTGGDLGAVVALTLSPPETREAVN